MIAVPRLIASLASPPCQVEVESDPAKLISDDSSSENQSRDQIWNAQKAHVKFICCDHKTKYLGHDFK